MLVQIPSVRRSTEKKKKKLFILLFLFDPIKTWETLKAPTNLQKSVSVHLKALLSLPLFQSVLEKVIILFLFWISTRWDKLERHNLTRLTGCTIGIYDSECLLLAMRQQHHEHKSNRWLMQLLNILAVKRLCGHKQTIKRHDFFCLDMLCLLVGLLITGHR